MLKIITRVAFVLAPVCLFLSFGSSALFDNRRAMSVLILLAAIFLVLALIGKAVEARRGDR